MQEQKVKCPHVENKSPMPVQLSAATRSAALATGCAGCLFLALAAMPAARAGQTLELPSLGAQLSVPEGWVVLEALQDRGVMVGEPGGQGLVLEILSWEPTALEVSAAAAAEAHQRVLAARYPYAAESQESFTAADGSPAVSVRGAVETPDGRLHVALYAAYCFGRRYFVLGTFCPPEAVAAVEGGFFREARLSLAPLSRKPAEPAPSGPPPGEPPPTAPGPVAPAAQPRVPAEFVTHRDSLGFTIPSPRGWQVEVVEGGVLVHPPGTREMGAGVLPVLARPALPVHQQALAAAEEWARRLGSAWEGLLTRLGSPERPLALATGMVALGDRAAQAVAVLVPGETVDVLGVVWFPAALSDDDRLRLARSVAGFQCLRLPHVAVPDDTGGEWTSEDGALQAHREAGWELKGSIQLYNGLMAIRMVGRHAASGAEFAWLQPELPVLKALTPALEKAGWTEGAQFPPDFGTEPLALGRRPIPLEAAKARVLTDATMGLKASGTSREAGRLLSGGTGAFADAQSQTMGAGCLLAVADAPPSLGRDCWMRATLVWSGPRGATAGAGGALRRVIQSTRISPDWFATTQEQEMLQKLLAGAYAAAEELPKAPSPTGRWQAEPSLLDGLATEAGPGVAVELPADAMWPWREAKEAIPELMAVWWEGR